MSDAADRSTSKALDVLNVALIDANGAIRPYLNVFLYVRREWPDGTVGLVTTVSSLFGLALQMPLGAAIDATRDKRRPLLVALIVVSFGAAFFGVSQRFWPVLVGSCLIAAAAGVLIPIVAALTVLVTPRARLTRRLGRNAAFERGGNVAIAIAIGVVGWLLPDETMFLMVPALCVVATLALYAIPRSAQRPARLDRGAGSESRLGIVLASRRLLVFALCAGLFHFANGPLLTLVGQDISRAHRDWSSTIVSICIVGAQAVMVAMAVLVGRYADRWGRKPLLVAGFLALPLRAVLYTFWHDPFWLIGVQLLDGVGAGLLSAAKPLVVADVMEGRGHYNLALGFVGTMQGIGAALSFVVAGLLVERAGFDAAYLACGGAALVALVALTAAMPETRRPEIMTPEV